TIVLTTHYLEEAEELADRIGLIDKGKILVVADKHELIQRYGEKTLRLVLAHSITTVPPSLAALGATLEPGGASLTVKQPLSAEVGSILGEVAAAGLAVRDVETRRTGLLEVYEQILHGDEKAPTADRGATGKSAVAADSKDAPGDSKDAAPDSKDAPPDS